MKETIEIDQTTAIVAREAIINLVINDWSAMDRSALYEAETALSDGLGWSHEFSEK